MIIVVHSFILEQNPSGVILLISIFFIHYNVIPSGLISIVNLSAIIFSTFQV